MKFKIFRTSDFREGKPCEGSEYYEGPVEMHIALLTNKAYQVQDTYWHIEINTLEELLKLCRDNGGRIIVDTTDEMPDIEIYDDYRE